MPLILRKCSQNGLSRNNFRYGNVGDVVTCPDWNPEPKCGNGLHGLLEGNGEWALLEGVDWLVIEAETEDIVNIDNEKCKFKTGKILFRGSNTELANSEFPHKLNLNSEAAFNWASNIGNKDLMINKITDSKWAYEWAIGYGNRDIMMHNITNSYWAFHWAYYIGNQDVMINKITDSKYAYYWALHIGNHDVMKERITDPEYIQLWNGAFAENIIMT